MAFNINQFISHVSSQNEFSMADKYEVFITVPYFLSLIPNAVEWGRGLLLTCENAELPGVDITPIEFRHYGFIQRIPHHLNFSPVNFTFYCTGKMLEKKFFDIWMDRLIPFNTGLISYPEDDSGKLTTTIEIKQYDNMANVNYHIKLFDAFPTSVMPLSLNWADESIHRLQVTLMYKRWTTINTQHAAIGDPSSLNQTSTPMPSSGGVNTYTNVNNKPPQDLRNIVLRQFGGKGGKFGGGGSSGGW